METCDECLRKFKEEDLKPSKHIPGKYCQECIEAINAAVAYAEAYDLDVKDMVRTK